ncbi:protein of unknown function [Acetitomaculum ruminis DSM 5522]|uniref:DUF4422 domain-containing protein n=1 Tax=Acetitomaculum ruminis DSM 5522 TaxID=1120918 RepID=A0A1I0WZ96_9FIRM|nr:DUF4422 domain-containing protein [Acetitomaculum ruminis]SFA94092.1 protein of unknown function [Acetitomaculum ruminis DSM 5522]
MSTSLFTIAHMKYTRSEPEEYQIIQAGADIFEEIECQYKDNTKDNISKKNPYYGELTAFYWLWKNYHDCDNIVICHYRCYFIDYASKILDKADFEKLLDRCDIVVPRPRNEFESFAKSFSMIHNIVDLLAVEKAILKIYPQYHESFKKVIYGKKSYYGNMFATSKKIMNGYMVWLFDIFNEIRKSLIISEYNDYQKRVYSFLANQLLMVYVHYNNLTFIEFPIGFTQEKQETIELKEELRRLVSEKKIKKAHEYFYDVMKKRPDLSYTKIEFRKELECMIQVIHTCEQEINLKTACMLDYSTDLDKLVIHHTNLKEILFRIKDDIETEFDIHYMINTNSSWIEFTMIIINDPILKEDQIELLNKIALIFYNEGIKEKVIPFFEQALGMDENNQETLTNLIDVLEGMEEYSLADNFKKKLFKLL